MCLFSGLLAGNDVRIGCHVFTQHRVHLGQDGVFESRVTVAPVSLIGSGAHTALGTGARVVPMRKPRS